jgi:hypothetical protein
MRPRVQEVAFGKNCQVLAGRVCQQRQEFKLLSGKLYFGSQNLLRTQPVLHSHPGGLASQVMYWKYLPVSGMKKKSTVCENLEDSLFDAQVCRNPSAVVPLHASLSAKRNGICSSLLSMKCTSSQVVILNHLMVSCFLFGFICTDDVSNKEY